MTYFLKYNTQLSWNLKQMSVMLPSYQWWDQLDGNTTDGNTTDRIHFQKNYCSLICKFRQYFRWSLHCSRSTSIQPNFFTHSVFLFLQTLSHITDTLEKHPLTFETRRYHQLHSMNKLPPLLPTPPKKGTEVPRWTEVALNKTDCSFVLQSFLLK